MNFLVTFMFCVASLNTTLARVLQNANMDASLPKCCRRFLHFSGERAYVECIYTDSWSSHDLNQFDCILMTSLR